MKGYLSLPSDPSKVGAEPIFDKNMATYEYFEIIGNFNSLPTKSNPGEMDPYIKSLGYRSLGKFNYESVRHIPYRSIASQKKTFLTSIGNLSKLQITVLQNLHKLMKTIEAVRGYVSQYMTTSITTIYGQPVQGIAIAMLLGNKEELEVSVLDLYKEQGLLHLIAISGLHMTFLYMMIELILKIIFPAPKIRFYMSFLCFCSYMLLLGFNVSALRAATMLLLYSYSVAYQLPFSGTRTFFITLMLYLFSFPELLFQCGFLLSYGAVFGVLIVSPIFTSFWKIQKRKRRSQTSKQNHLLDLLLYKTVELISVNVSVNIILYPILSYFFGGISVTGIIANLFIIPIVSIFYIFLFLSILMYFQGSILSLLLSIPVKVFELYIACVASVLNKIPGHYVLIKRLDMIDALLYYGCVYLIINRIFIIKNKLEQRYKV